MTLPNYQILRGKIEYSYIDSEVIIIHYDTGNYYTLSGSGAFIWHLVERQLSLDEIVSAISVGYDAPRTEALEATVAMFLGELVSENLVELTSDLRMAGDLQNDPSGTTGLSFETPVLERYSDMQALLVLDPIHEVDMQGWPHLPNGVE